MVQAAGKIIRRRRRRKDKKKKKKKKKKKSEKEKQENKAEGGHTMISLAAAAACASSRNDNGQQFEQEGERESEEKKKEMEGEEEEEDEEEDKIALTADTQKAIRNVIPKLERRRLYRGRGGEIIRHGTCFLVESIARAGPCTLPLPPRTQLRLLESIEDCASTF